MTSGYRVEIHPAQLQSSAEQLRSTVKRLRTYLIQAEVQANSIPTMLFAGASAWTVRSRLYNSIRDLEHMSHMINQFADDLEEAAALFSQADRALAGQRNTAGSFTQFLSQPQVLRNIAHELGLNGLVAYSEYLDRYTADDKILDLIGELGPLMGLDELGTLANVLDAALKVSEEGVSLDSISEAGMKS